MTAKVRCCVVTREAMQPLRTGVPWLWLRLVSGTGCGCLCGWWRQIFFHFFFFLRRLLITPNCVIQQHGYEEKLFHSIVKTDLAAFNLFRTCHFQLFEIGLKEGGREENRLTRGRRKNITWALSLAWITLSRLSSWGGLGRRVVCAVVGRRGGGLWERLGSINGRVCV